MTCADCSNRRFVTSILTALIGFSMITIMTTDYIKSKASLEERDALAKHCNSVIMQANSQLSRCIQMQQAFMFSDRDLEIARSLSNSSCVWGIRYDEDP
jgi:hypothetical protein